MSSKSYKINHTKKSKVMQATLLILLLSLFLFLFMQSRFFNCENIIVEGNVRLSKEEIFLSADVPLGNNLFYIDEKHIETKVDVLPLVDNVKVEKKLPNSILIKITEREPAAIIAGKEKFILVDVKGIYIQDVETIRVYNDLPIITGAVFNEDTPIGRKIDDKSLQGAIDLATKIWDDYSRYFSEIKITSEENDINLYTHEGVMIKIGSNHNIDEKLVLFEKLYTKQLQEGDFSRLEYIDISFAGLPVIKYK